MKLLYIWVENYKNMIINQSFNISSSYNINFDIEFNRLSIAKNIDYIENFYGTNILDITAIVGKNGVGKTTITKFIYEKCGSIQLCDEDDFNDSKQILVYEKGGKNGEASTLLIHYYLSNEPYIKKSDDLKIESIDLKNIKGLEYEQAEMEHDITTVYFTNALEISNVMVNQGLSELSTWGIHKSLCYTPMLSLQRSFTKLKNHYGACEADGGLMLLDVINQYAQNMTTDFRTPFATATSYNFLIAVRYLPPSLAGILPVMKDFELRITEFGEYIKSKKDFYKQSPFNQAVIFIRKNIYEHLVGYFKKYHWEQMYLNILCEIVLYLNMFNSGYKNVDFEILEKKYIELESEEALDTVLNQIPDDNEIIPKKELIRKIRNVQKVDLSIIKDFFELQDKNMIVLQDSMWYKQVQKFFDDYNTIKNIAIDKTVNFGFKSLVELIIKYYDDQEAVYGRMLSFIPEPMSSGETALINIFATIYSALKERTSGSILLIIDEIDAFLHPKWQQDILTHITRWINESKEFTDKKVQLIIATHSPIVLSDIPKDNILYLNESFNVSSRDQLTFGANINALFYDSFFMEQGSIGDIAKKEIQWAIDNIENKNLSLYELKKLKYVINNIGDKFLKEKLKSYFVYFEGATKGRNNL